MLYVQVQALNHSQRFGLTKLVLASRRLLPAGSAKPVPDYVPEPVRGDYEEACSILEMSPKAAATLARRALQGMIRDFHKIVRSTLRAEIEALKEVVDPLTWQAIDGVRSVGNIGAHMEKDINIIVEVDPGEAQQLIGLIEMLVNDWYVAKHTREEQLAALAKLAKEKESQRVPAPEANPVE